MIKVLVIGSTGQLGSEIQDLAVKYPEIDFCFTNSKTLDISKVETVSAFFNKSKFDYCINCAAYTQVDLAEEEQGKAFAINVLAVNNLAESCFKHKITLIHLSTDYIFDGRSKKPYKESDKPNPVNYYGWTKLKGEQVIREKLTDFFIIRTSWLYGSKGNNFVKTMLKLAKTKTELKVVDDQTGSPTNATDLASFILFLIETKNDKYGVYHFCNKGETTWYGFVKEIYKQLNIKTKLIPITTKEYPTKAERPLFSVLNTDKLANKTGFAIKDWKRALKDYL